MTSAVGKATPEQLRLLGFLADIAEGRWVSLMEIAHVVFVADDDDLFVPSLAARGWVEMASPSIAGCRITRAGRAVLAAREKPHA